jgi:hypothetical protein
MKSMTPSAFDTTIDDLGDSLAGAWRTPKQMLAEQEYDAHASIHDDATARKLGFKGGTIEGPTHFSQFAPLGERLWGNAWFSSGCISAHYRNPVFEGEEVRPFVEKPGPGVTQVAVWMQKRDGTEVLRGSLSVGSHGQATALDERLAGLPPLPEPVILHDIKLGLKTKRQTVRMDFDQNMGALYPFSLNQKLQGITEPSPWYTAAGGKNNPWGRPIIPHEMLSVLFQYNSREDALPTRGPAVGLFADQEIKLVRGPLFTGETYQLDREVVALSGSRKTESLWVRTTVYENGKDEIVATMLLNLASIKDSYANYQAEYAALYGKA